MFKRLGKFASDICNSVITIKDAKEEQDELVIKIRDLTEYNVRNQEKLKQKQNILQNVKQLFKTRNKIIDAFQNGVFLAPKKALKNAPEKQTEEEEKQTIPEWVLVSDYDFTKIKEKLDDSVVNNLGPKVNGKKIAYIHLQQFLQDMLDGKFNNTTEVKEYYSKNIYDKCERKIRSLNTEASKKMADVYDQARKMLITPSHDKTSDKADDEEDKKSEIIDIPEETEEFGEQEGQRFKILTPEQMLSRLAISLAQLKVGNNSQKLKNEIKKILYSLYRAKKLSKTIYISSINAI